MAKSQKVIITCAVTGSIHTPSMSPHIPVTASDVRIVHLSRRQPDAERSKTLILSSSCCGKPGFDN